LAAAFGISEDVLTTAKKQRIDNDVKVLYSNLKSIDSDFDSLQTTPGQQVRAPLDSKL
jgi:hypothetical protein